MSALSNAAGESLVRAAADALRRGEAVTARANLEQVTATGRAGAQIWLLLAHACRLVGDDQAEESALDNVLAAEPKAARALVMKGDVKARGGDERGAARFYKAAIEAAQNLHDAPPDLRAEIERARSAITEAQARFGEHLERSLAGLGVDSAARSPRFQQSLDLLAGRSELYLQRPTAYYFPELPQIQFYPRERFEWLSAIETKTGAICDEFKALLADPDMFRPYLVSDPDRPRSGFHGLVDNRDWSTLDLWEGGAPVAARAARCPRTMAALAGAPLPRISTRAPSVMFSVLRAGARIPPHHGMINARLICHLPLIVPDGCGFRVGNEVRRWEVGKALIFDDTIEHEAWNDGDEDRVVLIFDIWRPELEETERRAVTAIFEAIDDYEGGRLAAGRPSS